MNIAVDKLAYVKTYGCQMNVYDSEKIQTLLMQDGYGLTDDPAQADVIFLNTCHIREKAAEKVYSELGRLAQHKQRKPELKIGVAGCVAQAEGAEMLARAPQLDMVVGPQDLSQIPDLLRTLHTHGGKKICTTLDAQDKFARLNSLHRPPGRRHAVARAPSAFLTIQEGCDKFCTFCVVPYTRGGEVSRKPADIVAEADALLAQGVCDITLLGQNVNAWQADGMDFADLLHRLAARKGLARLRFTTSHPKDMTPALIACFRDLPTLMPYLHLPVQAGSARILRAMNRGYSVQDYLDIVADLRAARPDIALSSDFIVGFPGETEADFEATMALVEKVQFAKAYSFAYSARPGTPAADMDTQLDPATQRARLHRLQALLLKQQRAFNETFIGKTVDVLFEKSARAGQLQGRTPWLQAVHASFVPDISGQIAALHITGASANSLTAVVADTSITQKKLA